jgi:chorismate mutase
VECSSKVPQREDIMTLEELRSRIDELDRQLVELLNERARVVQAVGQMKAASAMTVYEPNREKLVYANVRATNKGPLPANELQHIYERILDVMRALQRNELASERHARGLKEDLAGLAVVAPPTQQHGSVAGKAGQAPKTKEKQ